MRSVIVPRQVIGLTCCALLAACVAATGPAFGDDPKPAGKGDPKKAVKLDIDPRAVVAHFIDGSVVKLTLNDDKFEVVTASGKKAVRLADVRKIEFASRVPDDLAKKIAAIIVRLGSEEFEQREKASDELAAIGVPACPALLAAAKGNDAEVKLRAASVLARIKAAVPEELLEVRDEDVVTTMTGKVVGKIQGTNWKATTPLFGEVPVKLSDVRFLRSQANPETEEEKLVVQPDPGTLSGFQGQVGKLFAFKVTGAVGNTVWGSDVYTTDSALATAAVHAGVLTAGKTGTVKVRIVAPRRRSRARPATASPRSPTGRGPAPTRSSSSLWRHVSNVSVGPVTLETCRHSHCHTRLSSRYFSLRTSGSIAKGASGTSRMSTVSTRS